MNQRHYLLKGTFILTLTGLLTRATGFFYKIFLSRTIGAAQIGLFQLTLPVYAFCMALSCGGIQTAVSRFTAEYCAEKDSRGTLRILACALLLSGGLSGICTAALLLGASRIARFFLLEPRCTLLLQMTALSIPFSALHGCIGGFFIGRKNVSVSAEAQFVEQLARIASVFIVFALSGKSGRRIDAAVMAFGQIAGELSAALFCVCHLFLGKNAPLSGSGKRFRAPQPHSRNGSAGGPAFPRTAARRTGKVLPGRGDFRRTVSVSLPLGLNRMLVCVLQGIEAALLPQMLQRYGYDSAQALTVYGTLSGMALPLILFPTAVTTALGTLLLPAVSEAQALHQDKKITGTVDAGFRGSLLLGLFFLSAFLLFGGHIGELLFHSEMAGVFTRKLALLCPFLYINTTLMSVLHGLGATTRITVWNTVSFGIRLAAILLLMPHTGADGYLAGMLLSQAFLTVCALFRLHRDSGLRVDLTDALIRPSLVCIASGTVVFLLKDALLSSGRTSWGTLLCLGLIYAMSFLALAFFVLPGKPARGKTEKRNSRMQPVP